MIKHGWPPNIVQISQAFPHLGLQGDVEDIGDDLLMVKVNGDRPTGILYAYGEHVYNPDKVPMPMFLLHHEMRHCARQFSFEGGAAAWWDRYVADSEFRYDEELYAHAEEYAWQVVNLPLYKDRNARARLAHRTAARLIAPLYNYQPPRTLKQAMRDLESLV